MSASKNIFDDLRYEVCIILEKYTIVSSTLSLYTNQDLINSYDTSESIYYPDFVKAKFPDNIPPWNFKDLKFLINNYISTLPLAYTLNYNIDTVIWDTKDQEKLFSLFIKSIVILKKVRDNIEKHGAK